MIVFLAGACAFYEGLTMELIGGGTGKYFLKHGNLKTKERYEDILSRRERQEQDNPCRMGGQEQINHYLGKIDENFWRGGNQGTGYMMTWFRL